MNARVGLAVAITGFVIVTDETVVGTTGDAVGVGVIIRNGVPVAKDAPGVRKRLIQAGCVRMDASTGSMNPLGRRVRKSLFGSRFESILVFSSQLGANRSAHCPAMITHRNPMIRIIGMMNQSRRSCSGTFIVQSIDWQSHENGCARIRCFVVTGALQPDAPMMRIHDPACNGKSETGSATFEFCFPGGV